MKRLSKANLALCFTAGLSLKTWGDVGNLDRELAIYKKMAENLRSVSLITYGGRRDKGYRETLGKLSLVSGRWFHGMPGITLAWLQLTNPFMFNVRQIDIIKTNQIQGSELAVYLKKKYHTKMIARCGYSYSFFIAQKTDNREMIQSAIELEKKAYVNADVGIVTTSQAKEWICGKTGVNSNKIKIIPNYVETNVFKPDEIFGKKYDLIYVGRGHEQKNLVNLLKALSFLKEKKNLDLKLLMIGGCKDFPPIISYLNKNNISVDCIGNVTNYKLPEYLNSSRTFILPSLYEGNPKTLLEAMSCGMPCIGTNVQGIKEDISHNENGYLCGTDYESIAQAIENVISDELLQKKMGINAREYILKNYALDQITKMELDVIQELLDT